MSFLIPDAPPTSEFQLSQHPTDPDGLVVIDASGNPAVGKVIYVGDAVIGGDTKHESGKGPVVKSPDGTKWRLDVDDAGVVTAEVV
ncbi:MAG TPA: hypothetical protein VM243_14420 [Phycisphaerae bacterium]|nr:hypothetical protein [Phycisphaerae bacterium]